MRYLFVKFYHFSQLLSEEPNDKNVNNKKQLEPTCTNPNLPKYMRRLKQKLDNDKDLWDIKMEGYFSSQFNNT